jgi:hypothetical protein
VARVGLLSQLCETVRDAIEDDGWKGCFQKSVFAYHKKTGLPIPGLWAAVEAVVSGQQPGKVLPRLQKSWGGSPEQWVRWFTIAKQRPDC